MKAYKKIISFILTLVMMLSLSVNVFAAEPLTDDPNMIEWKYTVFADESLQKVVEEGVRSEENTCYSKCICPIYLARNHIEKWRSRHINTIK